jgi:low affinity Fe/Cu permease
VDKDLHLMKIARRPFSIEPLSGLILCVEFLEIDEHSISSQLTNDIENCIMKPETPTSKVNFFERLASIVTTASGSTTAIILAFVIVIGWGICGPVFRYSQNWQLVINTGTTIVTFLMVFLIQKAQNKDSLAIQLKLNELVAAHEFASNRLVNVENMTEDELKVIQKYYGKLSEFAKSEDNIRSSHSIDEAHDQHDLKKEMEEEIERRLQEK